MDALTNVCDEFTLYNCMSFASDINECEQSPSVCDQNADCMNKAGSYKCTCRSGYSGDGKSCSGRASYYIRLDKELSATILLLLLPHPCRFLCGVDVSYETI